MSNTSHQKARDGTLAVDPGGHIGIAWKVDGNYHTLMTEDPIDLWDMIYRPYQVESWSTIIVEHFSTAGNMSTHGRNTIEIVGGVIALAHITRTTLILHSPYTRKAHLAKATGLLKLRLPKPVIHEHDALAHLLAWEDTGK